MNLDFKKKLLELYPAFDKVTGPYLRKDGRKHVTFNNSYLSKGDPNKTRTLSWPKALIEVREGRLLLDNETADHIDEDFTNDNINNLQILTRIDNSLKSFLAHPERYREFGKFICLECDIEFIKNMRDVRGNQVKQNKAGPFCSRRCAGLRNQKVQMEARLAQSAEAKVLNTFQCPFESDSEHQQIKVYSGFKLD
jgi:hypothetical protein